MEEFGCHGVSWIRWGGVVLFLIMEILKNQWKKEEKKRKRFKSSKAQNRLLGD
jgi:hypothetical protein